MRFSTVSAVLACAATACAQTAGFDAITAPTQDQNVAAGSTLDIVWEPTSTYNNDTITITLLEGSTPATLSTANVVASSIANSAGKYSWAIPSDIASFATYGFQLTLDSDSKIFQYSFPFHITGASSSSSSASSSATSAASTKTLTLSTATGYSLSPTISSTSSANSTLIIKTSSSASTLATVTSVKPTGNSTLTYITPTATASGSTASNTGTATSTSTPAAATHNAAVANIASGSLALFGGLILALAL